MKPRDASFSAIFVVVVLLHVGAIAWLLVSPQGCQESLSAAVAPSESQAYSKEPIRVDLTLSDRVAAATEANNDSDPRNAFSDPNDPASRLVLPQTKREPEVVRETPPRPTGPAPDLEKKKREDAQRVALLAQQQEREKEERARKSEAEKKIEEARRLEEARLLALKKAEDRERWLAGAPEREAKRMIAMKREEERKIAGAKQRKIDEAIEKEAARKRADRKAEDAVRERTLAAKQKAEKEAEEKRKRLAKIEEEKRLLVEQMKAEAARVQKEKRERELAEATRIEKAKVVENEKRIEKAKVVDGGTGLGGGQAAPAIVPAIPKRGQATGTPALVDMNSYRATVEKMIRTRWSIPKGIAVRNRPEVLLRIDRAGKVVYSRLNQSSGNPDLDLSAINAVRIGSRLIGLPKGYDKNVYEVTVKFQVD
ncbi:MAG: TolA protein [Verrucomicrobiales bacterium]|jgi:TolA protein